jgi:periplasmic divalent cation tolerance protein
MPDVPEILFACICCANLDEARRSGRALVEERLAAGVNIRTHETIYRWQGTIEQGPEAELIAKTTPTAYPALEQRVRGLHSYRIPCIVAFRPQAGLPDYLDWIETSVR